MHIKCSFDVLVSGLNNISYFRYWKFLKFLLFKDFFLFWPGDFFQKTEAQTKEQNHSS
jgi:hypothetical protein